MPKHNQIDPRTSFAPRLLPWILGAGMMVLYLVTLNHWVTLLNIDRVARVSGWIWQPQLGGPVSYLATLPFHLVPAAQLPAALNFFAALCAAITLGVLARSVAILPHDRTDLERWRERSDFSFLTGWVAWIPVAAAVIFAGLQFGFWQNATSFSGESFELLWFAVIIWQLLEYRLDEREGRLILATFLYGAGIIENWAFIGFFPLFLAMLIWLRGWSFFNGGFFGKAFLSGLGGFLLLLVLVGPLTAKFSGAYSLGIWESIKYSLRADWQLIRLVKVPEIRHALALISLTTLLPALVMSFRWSSTFGDSSRTGVTLVNYSMHFVNMVMLGVLVWLPFDPPFSPVKFLAGANFPIAGLTFYYIGALCIGYFTGYFLLIFGKPAIPSRRNPRPDKPLPAGLVWLCPVIVVGLLAILTLNTFLLVYKNAPAIEAVNDNSLQKLAHYTTEQLPKEGAILLCDSDSASQDAPMRAFTVQAELTREGRQKQFPVVDTLALSYPAYHEFLHRQFPAVWPEKVATNAVGLVDPLRVLVLLDQLAKSNNLCYLNPSFGYFFERFYQEPHGLVYQMKLLPTNTLIPPPLDAAVIAENAAFWKQVVADVSPAIQKAINPPSLANSPGPLGWTLAHLHVTPQANPNALTAGQYYSKSLNFLGVQVQRADNLDLASTLFADAQKLNSNNVVAGVNLAFNHKLRMGSANTLELSRITEDQFGKYRGWNEVLGANGPFDETSFCFGYACWLLQAGLARQAVAPFERVRQLVPDNLATRLFLAQIYVLNRQPDAALQALHDPMTKPFRFALTEFNSTELNELVAAADFQKGKIQDGVALLEKEMDRHPDDEKLMLLAAQTFTVLGLHTNALDAINRKLNHTPNDPNWLFGKGYVSLRAGAYDQAISALTKFLDVQTNQPAAIFNRGLAYYQSGRLDEARADFLRLQAVKTNSYQVAYDLAEIAWRQNQTNEAVRNYQIYLANAPTNAPEQKIVRDRMSQVGAK